MFLKIWPNKGDLLFLCFYLDLQQQQKITQMATLKLVKFDVLNPKKYIFMNSQKSYVFVRKRRTLFLRSGQRRVTYWSNFCILINKQKTIMVKKKNWGSVISPNCFSYSVIYLGQWYSSSLGQTVQCPIKDMNRAKNYFCLCKFWPQKENCGPECLSRSKKNGKPAQCAGAQRHPARTRAVAYLTDPV